MMGQLPFLLPIQFKKEFIVLEKIPTEQEIQQLLGKSC